jgi:aminoglycoside phosphotransferase (APT) family kinase protein
MASKIAEGLRKCYYNTYPERENQEVYGVKEITKGWETDLFFFDLEFVEKGRLIKKELVARLHSGKYAENKTESEFNIINRLYAAGYPAPQVFAYETNNTLLGKPFLIMERIKGRDMIEDLLGADGKKFESLLDLFVRLMVELHELNPAMIYPEGFDFGDAAGYTDRNLNRVRNNINTDLAWLTPVIEWLEERKSMVKTERLSIIHQDFHPNNVMLREDDSPVVIDWTAAKAGDFREDLAWTVLLTSTYADPVLGKTIKETYQKVSGRNIIEFEFFEVMAILRRMIDVYVSFTSGAEERGMRQGAVEMMRKEQEPIRLVYGSLIERTGLKLKEFEELLHSIED